MANGACGLIAIDTGAKGPALAVLSACASGADGIGLAFKLIRGGEIDAAIAGASEASISKVGIGAYGTTLRELAVVRWNLIRGAYSRNP